MRRFFGFSGTRRLIVSGKNRISILNPYGGWSALICQTLHRLAVLSTLCMLTMLLLQQHRMLAQRELEASGTRTTSRIFCIIATYGQRHSSAAVHVKRTWAQHCDHLLFVSDDAHEELEPAVFHKHLDKWQLLRAQLRYVYKYHFDEGDWFLYANDDNFVVVENLRSMLQAYSPEQLIYFGCKMRSIKNHTYMYDRAGMVLSSAALRQFVLEALPNVTLCSPLPQKDAAAEHLGRCLSNVNVEAGDSRDHYGQHRFLPFHIKEHMGKPMNTTLEQHKSFLARSYYRVPNLTMLASARVISSRLEYVPHIYNLYYLTYKIRIFGAPPLEHWMEPSKD